MASQIQRQRFLAMYLLVACVLGEDHVRAQEKLDAVLEAGWMRWSR